MSRGDFFQLDRRVQDAVVLLMQHPKALEDSLFNMMNHVITDSELNTLLSACSTSDEMAKVGTWIEHGCNTLLAKLSHRHSDGLALCEKHLPGAVDAGCEAFRRFVAYNERMA